MPPIAPVTNAVHLSRRFRAPPQVRPLSAKVRGEPENVTPFAEKEPGGGPAVHRGRPTRAFGLVGDASWHRQARPQFPNRT
jgi:hypothetical protein